MEDPADLPALIGPSERTLPRMLRRQAALHGPRKLLDIGGDVWTFADTLEMAARFGGTLRGAGIERGDHVAVICGNRAELLQVYLGCGWIGAVTVPINVASRGAQLAHILTNSQAKLLVVQADHAEALETLDAVPPSLRAIWLIGDAPVAPRWPNVSSFPAPAEPVPEAPVGPGDTVAILYTSGTTGVSKGVCCPHAQYFWWGVNTARLLGVRGDDVLLTTLPLFHTNALNTFYQALLTGASLVVEPRFSASGFAPSLTRHGATVTYLLGAMVPILLSRPSSELDRAHRVRIALAPGVPERFHPEFRDRFGIALLDGYGSTETNFVLGCAQPQQRGGAMGPVFEGFDARVVDDADNTLPNGVPGELVLRADEPFAFATGYFGMPEKTVEAWRNLWFHTGDRVVRDAEGYYRFIDRMKDAIRRRGENVSSYEVEQVLLSHPDVAEAAAFPVQSELAEDEVMVAIVPRDGHALTPAILADYCRGRMPVFAIPRFIEFVTALPMTENGKVQKFRLRERGVTGATWDRQTRVTGWHITRPPGSA
ncbi:MAG TPA: ATP-dependent acyl-CoA ligase [Acetobacteraceae bacterium]|nr:ATP-dependent acyl-CoA ligase [Acetobacteraceae bacterium]